MASCPGPSNHGPSLPPLQSGAAVMIDPLNFFSHASQTYDESRMLLGKKCPASCVEVRICDILLRIAEFARH